MEVDEVPRSSGRFNLDRSAQEHINEGLEVCIPPEPVSSVRGLEAQPIRPLMEVTLPGYTLSSTPGSSQIGGSSSPLKELHNRLQLGTRDDSTRVERPPTWRDQSLGELPYLESYANLHVVFAETEIMVHLRKKYYLSIA